MRMYINVLLPYLPRCNQEKREEGLSKRHLIRLWLHDPRQVWRLPAALQLAWERTFADELRGSRWDAEPLRSPDGSLIGNQMSQCD